MRLPTFAFGLVVLLPVLSACGNVAFRCSDGDTLTITPASGPMDGIVGDIVADDCSLIVNPGVLLRGNIIATNSVGLTVRDATIRGRIEVEGGSVLVGDTRVDGSVTVTAPTACTISGSDTGAIRVEGSCNLSDNTARGPVTITDP